MFRKILIAAALALVSTSAFADYEIGRGARECPKGGTDVVISAITNGDQGLRAFGVSLPDGHQVDVYISRMPDKDNLQTVLTAAWITGSRVQTGSVSIDGDPNIQLRWVKIEGRGTITCWGEQPGTLDAAIKGKDKTVRLRPSIVEIGAPKR